MRLSVACNFDPDLIPALSHYPVYEVYGKQTEDFFGGGRPSFYLPRANAETVEKFVQRSHQSGIAFNYLLNASCMANLEFTKEGQTEFRRMLDWLCSIGVDSVTTASPYFLRTIKRCYPQLKVRISSHRYTDNPRKVRFWEDNGADCIVVSEVNIYRDLETLKAMREAVRCDLQLIVNNSCRQDCAIAGTHAVSLSHGSQHQHGRKKGFPLDYCFLECTRLKLTEPVNYVRANWIRPEDLHIYESLGYDAFKIVERNTPTAILLERVEAYTSRHYDGNLLDLVQCYAYPYEKFTDREKDAFSLRRLFKYFVRPRDINMLRFVQVMQMGRHQGVLFARTGEPGVYVDNQGLNGYLQSLPSGGCQHLDCERCRICHEWSAKTVRIDPQYRAKALQQLDRMLDDLWSGKFWSGYARAAWDLVAEQVLRRAPDARPVPKPVSHAPRPVVSAKPSLREIHSEDINQAAG